jgi:hypothetical protein
MTNKNKQLPPIVLECPECGERYLISQQNEPSEKAIIFSDGFFIDEVNWRTPLIIGCLTCELGFFPNKGKYIASPDWDEFNEKWSHIKKAEAPTAGALVLELRARKKLSPDDEKALRTELWYAGNHSETGKKLKEKNPKFNLFLTENIASLENILFPNNTENILLKAEANRQLGHFDKCIGLIDGLKSPISETIKTAALAGLREPVKVYP